jgi:hypothetical protein
MITGLVRVTLGKTPDTPDTPDDTPARSGLSGQSGVNPNVDHTTRDKSRNERPAQTCINLHKLRTFEPRKKSQEPQARSQ